MQRQTLRDLGLTDEQIEAVMIEHSKDIQGEQKKIEGYKTDSLKLVELTKQLEAMKNAETEKAKEIETKDTQYADLEKKFAELQADLKTKELKANLAEKGIVGENADKLIASLGGANIDVDVLCNIIAEREKGAVDSKIKELEGLAGNPSASAGSEKEKPADVANVEGLSFGTISQNAQQARDFYK